MSKIRKDSLEEQAHHFWQILLLSGLSDGHCKSYDPLTIDAENGGYTFRSYIFDHDDGSRSRWFKTLEEGQLWLLASFDDWLTSGHVEDMYLELQAAS